MLRLWPTARIVFGVADLPWKGQVECVVLNALARIATVAVN
jgi:hypothetical protein